MIEEDKVAYETTEQARIRNLKPETQMIRNSTRDIVQELNTCERLSRNGDKYVHLDQRFDLTVVESYIADLGNLFFVLF